MSAGQSFVWILQAGNLPPADLNDSAPHTPADRSGTATWQVSEPYLNLWLLDEALGYQPALGPRAAFSLAFKQRDTITGYNTNVFSAGKKWNFSWLSYISSNNIAHFSGGRQRIFAWTNIDYLTSTRMSGDTTNGYTVFNPDGSEDVYGFVVTNSAGAFQEALLTRRQNPQGRALTFNYYSNNPDNPVVRLQNVVDADGRTNYIYYNTTNVYSTNLISQVTDPVGRSCHFSYDSSGRLTNITDAFGVASSFSYDATDLPVRMTTPFGSTSFMITDSALGATDFNGRSVRAIQPDGGVDLFLATNGAAGIASSDTNTPKISPYANTLDNSDLDKRNTFHWGPRQYQALSTTNISSLTSDDFVKARLKHWLLTFLGQEGETLSLEHDPSPNAYGSLEVVKTWYYYAGKTNNAYEGTLTQPLFLARVLPDSSTWFSRIDLNVSGRTRRNFATSSSGGQLNKL